MKVKKKLIKADPKNALFIINPVSGQGDKKKRKEEILKIAKELGWKGKVVETTKILSAGKISTEEMKNGVTHIVVCGGDGTIMEALQVIINTGVILGIVPLGTGNLFAQNLNITGSRKDMIQRALFGTEHKLDVGWANGTIFAIIAGMGFDADVMRQAKRSLKTKFGPFAYLVSGFKNLHRRAGKYKVIIDGEKSVTYTAKGIMIANMGQLQGGIEAVPKASSQNGVLRVGIIQASGYPAWLSLLGNALLGNINKSPHYTLLEGKKITVESLRGPKAYQCDGNHFPPTKKIFVEIFPKAATVLIDKDSKPGSNNIFSPILNFQKIRVYTP